MAGRIWTPRHPRIIQPFPNKPLVAVWRFRHGTGPQGTVFDESGNGYHATATAATSSSYHRREGPTGAREESGRIYVSNPTGGESGWQLVKEPDFTGLGEATVVGRVSTGNFTSSDGKYARLFSRASGTSTANHQLMLGWSYSGGYYGLFRARASFDALGTTAMSATDEKLGDTGRGFPNDDEWHQYSATISTSRDEFTLRTLRDGAADFRSIVTVDPPGAAIVDNGGTYKTFIGTNTGSSNAENNFQGYCSYLYVYAAELSPEELFELGEFERERRYEQLEGFLGWTPETGDQEVTANVATATAVANVATAANDGAPQNANAAVAVATAVGLVATASGSGAAPVTAEVAVATAIARQATASGSGAAPVTAEVAVATAIAQPASAANAGGPQFVNAATAVATAVAHTATASGSGAAPVTAEVATATAIAFTAVAQNAGGPQYPSAAVAIANAVALVASARLSSDDDLKVWVTDRLRFCTHATDRLELPSHQADRLEFGG